jgi:hypothetical protein
MARPFAVALRLRNPHFRARLILEGLYVRFIAKFPLCSKKQAKLPIINPMSNPIGAKRRAVCPFPAWWVQPIAGVGTDPPKGVEANGPPLILKNGNEQTANGRKSTRIAYELGTSLSFEARESIRC